MCLTMYSSLPIARCPIDQAQSIPFQIITIIIVIFRSKLTILLLFADQEQGFRSPRPLRKGRRMPRAPQPRRSDLWSLLLPTVEFHGMLCSSNSLINGALCCGQYTTMAKFRRDYIYAAGSI